MKVETYDAREAIFTIGEKWWVCEDYELIEYNEVWYVTVKSVAVKEYSPFDVKNELLKDFIDIRLALQAEHPCKCLQTGNVFDALDKKQQKAVADRVLKFVKKYGMLGLIWHLPHSKEQEERAKVYDNTVLNDIPDMLSFIKEIAFLRHYIVNGDLSPNEKNYIMSGFTTTFFPTERYVQMIQPIVKSSENAKRPTVSEFFKGAYSEPVSLILNKVLEVYDYVVNESSSPSVKTGAISIELVPGKPSKIGWSFSSLIDAMLIILCQNALVTGQMVKICDNCGSAFITNKPVAKYCSNACGNAYRVWRSRNKGEKH